MSKIDPKLGVAPSPRVTTKSHIPSGGGRYHVGKPYKIAGRWYKPREVDRYEKVGLASWYGDAFHGRKTANGESFNMNALSAAHPTLPLPSYVRVTNLSNKRSVIVRVNDRGPFSGNRIIDLSRRTADVLGMRQKGVAKVHIAYLGTAPIEGRDDKFLAASYSEGRPAGIRRINRVRTAQEQRPRSLRSVSRAIQNSAALTSQRRSTPDQLAGIGYRDESNASNGPLLVWGDAVPPVGSGYGMLNF